MSAFAIKMFALVCMTIDHMGAMFPDAPIWFRVVGRFSFTVFAFFIAEGCRRTSSFEKYLVRLGVLAVVSEIPYDLFFEGGGVNYFLDMNVVFTLFTGALLIYFLTKTDDLYLKLVLAICVVVIGGILGLDYGLYGVFLIVGFYYIRKKWQIALFTILMFAAKMGRYAYPVNIYTFYCFFSCISFIPILLYNGEKGRNMGGLFYIFYPLHIILLGVCNCFLTA